MLIVCIYSRWCFDETVTHFIYQGRQNDNNREYKSAKERGIYIVSQHWILESAQEYKRLAESLYPHTYNPKMNLNISGVEDDIFSQRLDTAGKEGKGDKNNSQNDNNTKKVIDQINEIEQKQHEPKGVLTQTLEMRENFQKQLQEIMTATSLAKLQGQRNSFSRNGFESSPTTPEGPRSARNGRSRILEALRKSHHGATDVNTEPSQNEQIIWDDPTAREERARLASNLQWPNSPSQYSEQSQTTAVPPEELLLRKYLSDTEIIEMGNNNSTKIDSVEVASLLIRNPETPIKEDHLIPTPLAPAIAFPLANPLVAPQPKGDITKIDQTNYEEPTKMHRFQLSSLNPQERINYYQLIEELGGMVLEKQCFDLSCTHTIVGQPLRNEKFLASMAAGKWVLHRSYLEACRAAHRFVKGAFGGWSVILNVDPAKESGFKRLLESGGAKVLSAYSPSVFREVTHFFADLNKLKPEDVIINIREATAQGVNCLKPEYIADYLIQEPPPSVENYLLPEAAAYLQNSKILGIGLSQKRKAAEEKHSAKRSRIH
ncbi:DNA topoisomerase 2-binding protein 1-like isoform X2 [Erythrolamprus reginae]|uniref:DNA topoisomerase 2-binding protein 1-like isoform X2 n=1 Tax=Erythrolamprus reginae TaxID=121349 RepID=UPI00396CBBE9